MFVEIRTRNLMVTPELEAQLKDHVAGSLARLEPQIRSVVVRLEDVNGPRGGVDKVCRTTATLRGGRVVVSEGRSDRLRQALGLAVVRTRAQIRSRTQKRARSSRQPLVARMAS